MTFEGESLENLESFHHLTSAVDILGIPVPSKQKMYSSKCKKVECAVKEIFGPEVGIQLLFMHRKFGMNGSHVVKEATQAAAWRKDELDTVLLSLSDFPDGILPIQDSRPFIHAPRTHGNGSTLANAVITIYELWNKQSKPQQRSTVFHELGHAVAGVTKLDDSSVWMSKSGWSKTTKNIGGKNVEVPVASKPETIVSEYGKTNEWEDLAESVVAYRYNPAALKSMSADKYNFLKKTIFDNVEYTSESACKNPDRLSNKLKGKAEQKMRAWVPDAEELKQIAGRCSNLAIQSLAVSSSIVFDSPEFRSCYERSVQL